MKSAGFEKAFVCLFCFFFVFTHSWLVRKMLKSADFFKQNFFFLSSTEE